MAHFAKDVRDLNVVNRNGGEMNEIQRPACTECGKEIWGISRMLFTIGVERPSLLHAVCFERLKDIEKEYRKDIK